MPVSRPGTRRSPSGWSVATQTFVLQVAVALLVVTVGLLAAYAEARRAQTQEATSRAKSVARSVASTPDVIDALASATPSETVQDYAEDVRRATGTDFVVVMTPDGTRFSHPDRSQLGKKFIGHIDAAARGGEVVEDYTGTLGPSRRVVVPVTTDAAEVVGLVSVGIRRTALTQAVRSQLPVLLVAGAAAALLSGLGTGLVTRRMRRQTLGLGEQQLREMYEYHDAVLHAVTEGLLIVDTDGRLQLANDEAVRLLGISEGSRGRALAELGLSPALTAALSDGKRREDELHVTDARVLVLATAPALWQGKRLGTVATLRDRTDLEHLTGELDSARGVTEALRSQAHESANRIHTIVSLIELGHTDRALEFATDELAVTQQLTDAVLAADVEPTLAALLLGKSAQANERGIDPRIAPGAAGRRRRRCRGGRRSSCGARSTRRWRSNARAHRRRQRTRPARRHRRLRLPPWFLDQGRGRGGQARHRPGARCADGGAPGRRARGDGSARCGFRRAAARAWGGRGHAVAPRRTHRRRSWIRCASEDGSMTDPLHVFIVEDEPVSAEAHAIYVARVPGFVVAATASSGQAALKALQRNVIDVVLLDMNLPDLHGLEVVRAMRAAGHTADVIAVSSAPDLDIMRSSVSLGVVQYVLKPSSPR